MKKLTDTFNGDRQKQVDTILRILWAIRNDDSYYFFEYGKDILNRYFNDCRKENIIEATEEEWTATPKKRVPLKERLEMLSVKLKNKHSMRWEEFDLTQAYLLGQKEK